MWLRSKKRPKEYPGIEAQRLILRRFELSDSAAVQRLAGDRAIAATTLRIPHPYEYGDAMRWIGEHKERFEKGQEVVFAIVKQASAELVGAAGLTINREFNSAELGYWIGKDYWGQGYCTEAARAVVRYGFEQLGLNRIHAHHLASNPASGRVMAKVGMVREGLLRRHVKK